HHRARLLGDGQVQEVDGRRDEVHDDGAADRHHAHHLHHRLLAARGLLQAPAQPRVVLGGEHELPRDLRASHVEMLERPLVAEGHRDRAGRLERGSQRLLERLEVHLARRRRHLRLLRLALGRLILRVGVALAGLLDRLVALAADDAGAPVGARHVLVAVLIDAPDLLGWRWRFGWCDGRLEQLVLCVEDGHQLRPRNLCAAVRFCGTWGCSSAGGGVSSPAPGAGGAWLGGGAWTRSGGGSNAPRFSNSAMFSSLRRAATRSMSSSDISSFTRSRSFFIACAGSPPLAAAPAPACATRAAFAWSSD